MKRKDFIKYVAGTGVSLSIGAQFGCNEPKLAEVSQEIASEHKGLPEYWIWHRPSTRATDDELKAEFADMKALGIDAVLPQIFASNKALFNIPDYETELPLLERMIPLAHQAGLELHAWMWTMPCNNPRIIADHPDWYAVNRAGQSADTAPAYVNYYKFLCPRKTEVREFVQKRVEALASISELNGVHLDYVRLPDVILAEALQPKYDIVQDKEYPEYDYCYCETCRSVFKEQTGIDPMDIEDPANDKDWYQFRYDAVVGLVNDYLVPAAKAKNKTITAAVFPNWESVRQQWHKFDLDAFLPMLYHGFYNEDIAWIGKETTKALDRLNHKKPIYSGLFLPHVEEEGALTKAIQSSYDGGSKGFTLFSYHDLKDYQKEELASIIKSRS